MIAWPLAAAGDVRCMDASRSLDEDEEALAWMGVASWTLVRDRVELLAGFGQGISFAGFVDVRIALLMGRSWPWIGWVEVAKSNGSRSGWVGTRRCCPSLVVADLTRWR
ncbi:hypothetical protein ACLOJK_029369 [Asimina triloba]